MASYDLNIILKATDQGMVGKLELTEKQLIAVANSTKRAVAQTAGWKSTLGVVSTALGAYGLALKALDVLKYADQYQVLDERIKNATKATGDYASVWAEIKDISIENGAAVESTVGLFQRLQGAAKELGATNKDVLALTDTVQKLGVIGGSTTEQMSSGIEQFGQMMSGQTVKTEEFKSLLSGMPALTQHIADGLGLSVGEMARLVEKGGVASKDVFAVLMAQAGAISEEFAAMPVSLTQSLSSYGRGIGLMLAELDKTLGITDAIATALRSVAESAKNVADDIRSRREHAEQEEYIELLREERKLRQQLAELSKVEGNDAYRRSQSATLQELGKRYADVAAKIDALRQSQQGQTKATEDQARATGRTTDIQERYKRLLGELGTAEDKHAKEIVKKTAEMDKLHAKYDESFANLLGYTQAQSELKTLYDAGRISLEQWTVALNEQMNATLGLNDATQDQADGLDALQAKYDEVYAAILSYEQVQADLKRLYDAGRISLDDYTQALNDHLNAQAGFGDKFKEGTEEMSGVWGNWIDQLTSRAFDGFDDIGDMFESMIKNMIATALANEIKIRMTANASDGGAPTGTGTGSSGGFTDLFSGSGGTGSFAKGLNNFSSDLGFGNNYFGGTNFGYGLAGIGGGLIGNWIAGDSKYGSLMGSIGGMAGYGLATGAFGSSIGAATGMHLGAMAGPIGMIIGSVLAALLSKLMGGKPSDKTQTGAIDLSTGETQDLGYLPGDKKYDEKLDDAVNQASTQISLFSQHLEALAGKDIGGAVRIDFGQRDGFHVRVAKTLEELEGAAMHNFATAEEAMTFAFHYVVDQWAAASDMASADIVKIFKSLPIEDALGAFDGLVGLQSDMEKGIGVFRYIKNATGLLSDLGGVPHAAASSSANLNNIVGLDDGTSQGGGGGGAGLADIIEGGDDLVAMFPNVDDAAAEATVTVEGLGEVSNTVYGYIDGLRKEGESFTEAYLRVSSAAEATYVGLEMLGTGINLTGTAGVDAAVQLVEMTGGLEAFSMAIAGIAPPTTIYDLLSGLNTQFTDLGVTLPASRAEFQALIAGIDLTTEAGRQQAASLLALQPAWEQAKQAMLAISGIDMGSVATQIRDGLLGRVDSTELGANLGDLVVGGIENALASSVADQITSLIFDQLIMPALTSAIMQGGLASGALSEASLNGLVTQVTAQADGLATLMADPAFLEALARIKTALNGVATIAPDATDGLEEVAYDLAALRGEILNGLVPEEAITPESFAAKYGLDQAPDQAWLTTFINDLGTSDEAMKAFAEQLKAAGISAGEANQDLRALNDYLMLVQQAIAGMVMPSTETLYAEHEQSGMSLWGKTQASGQEIWNLAGSFDGSLEQINQIGDAVRNRYNLELQMLAQIDQLASQTANTLAGTRENIMLSVMGDEDKFDYYKAQADQLAGQLSTATDPEQIAYLTGEINRLINSSYGLLDEEGQKARNQEYLDYIDDIGKLAEDRYDVAEQTLVAEHKTLEDMLTKMSTSLNGAATTQQTAAGQQQAAANTMQQAASIINAAISRIQSPVVNVAVTIPASDVA